MEIGKLMEKMGERKSAMKTERTSFEPHWRDISEVISTRTSRFLRSDRNRGEKVSKKIINETATIALRTLESGMMAGMSSPARPWFVLGPPDPGMKKFGPVRDWLDTVTKIMLEAFARSNLYSALPKAYGSIGGYGTGAFGVLDDDKEIFRCYPFPVGSFYVDCNHRLNVDACYREFSMTVRQVVERYGKKDMRTGSAKWDNFSKVVKDAYQKGNYGMWVPMTHAVETNIFADTESILSREKPYISVYYEDDGDKDRALNVSGFDEFPIMVPRWHVNGEDVYGTRCPGMDALGATKMLQLEERRKYQIIDKIWNPPMNADAMLRNTGTDLLPGGMNWTPGMSMTGNLGLRPVHDIHPSAVNVIREDIQDVCERIRRTFYEDLMLMMATSDNSQMTAREVEERHSEKLLVLGPMMEQQNDDLFDRLIDRTFNSMMRRGKLPPPPPELENQSLRVEYISLMAQAQKLIGVSSHERFIGFVGQLAAAQAAGGVPSTAWDKVDINESIDEYGISTGITGKIIRSNEEVEVIQTSRAKAQQSAQMAAQMPALAQGAGAMKTLSETSLEGDTALQRLMAQMGGGV